ncbi:MAG: hypothetical protein B6229_01750 [Spirochaetaceae bacterium 4572_7]|nr:MAG: hypothetical protein B6229_01750 [Spirochaetaceae bacterium 4572_7]
MQRSISHQKPLVPFVYIILFIIYGSLSSIYLFLPPLLAVLFVLFSNAMKREDLLMLILVSICLLMFEANKGYMVFSSIVYFALVYKFVMPKIIQNFSCSSCIKISYVLLAYLGYYIYLVVISNIFLLPAPEINFYIIYYIIIEFFLVSLL